MGMGLLRAQSFKSVWVGQHLAALLGQGGEATGDLLLLSHANLKHMLSFLPGWRTTQGGQAQRDAIRILDLAHPVLLGQAEKRFDRIGYPLKAGQLNASNKRMWCLSYAWACSHDSTPSG